MGLNGSYDVQIPLLSTNLQFLRFHCISWGLPLASVTIVSVSDEWVRYGHGRNDRFRNPRVAGGFVINSSELRGVNFSMGKLQKFQSNKGFGQHLEHFVCKKNSTMAAKDLTQRRYKNKSY